MPRIEICQGDRRSLVYGAEIPCRRTFMLDGTTVGLTNKRAGFSWNKLIVFQDGCPKYQVRESNRLNWAVKLLLPLCALCLCFALQLFFPGYEVFWVLLFLICAVMIDGAVNRQYAVFQNGEEIGFSRERWFKPIASFAIQNSTYRVCPHRQEQYSLFKDGAQIALYRRKLEKSRNRYLIYYSADEPVEIIELFCLWIDMFNYDDERGRAILKTFCLSDRHPEETLWRPGDIEGRDGQ